MTAPPFPCYPMPVSPEIRLTYVLQHFWQAYETVPPVSIGYPSHQPQIEVAEASGPFFEQQHPYPPAPTWRQWQGRTIPFFFDSAPDNPLIEWRPNGQAIIYADIISAAFYLLSGWQEYFSEERDQHGRFPYSASVQHRYNFVTIPVVNYYFDVLKTAVEHAIGQPLRLRRWAGKATWACCITHDIDNLYSAWKAPAKAALRQGNLRHFGRQLWQHFTTHDTWDNLSQVQQKVAEYGAKSTFFFLPEYRKAANGTPNADYNIQKVWAHAATAIGSAEVGLHASVGTNTQGGQLKEEGHRLQRLRNGVKADGIRFHYLSWEPRITPGLLDELLYTYDSTLGFAEHFGFRNSYCLPFHPFNFQQRNAFLFLEIPLNVMDATLHHPRYLQLAPEEIAPALTPMLQEIERFGGVCTVLWHNENFDPANTHNGPQEFHTLMQYLCSRNPAFLHGQDIVLHLEAEK